MITKEEYNKALELVEKYEDQVYERVEFSRPNIEEEVQEFTKDGAWYINDVNISGNQVVVELSNNEYDEDFSMSKQFKKFLETLDNKYDITLRVDYGLYGK